MSRPEVLFPLFASLKTLAGIGPRTEKLFAQMGIERPRDLLFTLPSGGVSRRVVQDLATARPPENIAATLEVRAHHAPTARNRPFRVSMSDGQTEMSLVFFRARGDWVAHQLPIGARRLVSGKVDLFDGRLQMVHPDHILPPDSPPPPDFEPTYPATQGLNQKTIVKSLGAALEIAPNLPEWIHPGILSDRGWAGWRESLHNAHQPQNISDIAGSAARSRLAYDEILAHQMTLALIRRDRRARKGRASRGDGGRRRALLASLPYAPTGAQSRAIAEIEADMAAPSRMNRLVQGDVGAGKTLVAMMAMLIAVEAGGQAVMMAPTAILARQHFHSLGQMADAVGVRLGLLTGRDSAASRAKTLQDLAAGQIDILIGTHAVFQEGVTFADLRLAVIDEQHRFGVSERLALAEKGVADLLVMTATPIPRSLAMTHYGDLEVSVLDEKPPGRQPIKTVLIPDTRETEVIEALARALDAGARAYWVCPLVEESETSDLMAAQARFQSLEARFGARVRLVHGQMPHAERDAAMADFAAGRAQILVATTVIEVGVNVPEATVMVIERAEIFGLAQLHQLRGRVGRGSAASSCLLLYHPPLSDMGQRRLAILRDSEDGFRIAEEDLAIRGAGDVIGTAQSGLPRFRIANLEHQVRLMELARSDARTVLANDPDLSTERGQAIRVLLYLQEQDRAIKLLSAG